MKTSTKQKLIKALAAAFVLTAAGGTVFAINSISNDKVETPFNGTYNGTLTAFAEETSTEGTGSAEGTETATQVGNLVLKKMISVDNKYMLLAASIDNVAEYKAIGYYITENGVTTKKEGNTYYTGIQVKTDNNGGTKTYYMSDIYNTEVEYSYENAGMIVCEIPYTVDAEYDVTPYLINKNDEEIKGTLGHLSRFNVINGGFEKGNLDGWDRSVEGLGDVSDAVGYWGEPLYNKDGNYLFSAYTVKTQDKPEYDQGGDEPATGTLTSSTFTLGGSGWISFKLGGARNGTQVYLEVVDAGTNEAIARYYNSEWTDAGSAGCKLNAYRADLSDHIGNTLKIRVTDNATGDYGLFFLDSVQTYHKEVPTTGVEALNLLYNVVNGGFENGNLDGWTGLSKGVISAETYWGEKLPYNQEGSYHLDGWGTEIKEAEAWSVKSTTFKLGGCGYISARMGGNAAALKVYKANGELVGVYKANKFSDTNFPYTGDGEGKGAWADMRTYFIDLHEYIGQELYIELHDTGAGAWAQAFFDAINCYYKDVPDIENGYDTVTAPISKEGDAFIYGEVTLKWTKLEKSAE